MSSDDLFGERRIEYRGTGDNQPQDAYSFSAGDTSEESPFGFDDHTDTTTSSPQAPRPAQQNPPRTPPRAASRSRRPHLQAVPTPQQTNDAAEAQETAVMADSGAGADQGFASAFDDDFDEFGDFTEDEEETPDDSRGVEPAVVAQPVRVPESATEVTQAIPTVTVQQAPEVNQERIAGVTTGKRVANHSYTSVDLPTPKRTSLISRLTGMLPKKKAKGPTIDELRFIRRNLTGSFNISVVNIKGGVGKTVTADLLGKTFSSQRNDRVIAVDATPEGGELIDRCRNENNGTIRSLIEQLPVVSRYSHIREHTSQSDSGLEVLGADPSVVGEQRLTGDEYRSVMKVLRTYYQVIITDCAQGVTSELMEAVLDETDLLVLVSEGADGMRAATKTANDLASPEGYWGGRYANLVDDMVVVVNSRTPRSNVKVDKVEEFFSGIARAVVTLPFDQALEGGRGVELSEMSDATRAAGIDLASKIAASSSFKDGGR